MEKAKKHPLLQSPIRFGQERTEKAYDFALGLKGLKHVGLRKEARPYEPDLRTSVIAACEKDMVTIDQLAAYIVRLQANAWQRLEKVIKGQKYEASNGAGKKLIVMSSFERIIRLINMTMSIALQVKSVTTELTSLRKAKGLQKDGHVTEWLMNSGESPTLSTIATVQGVQQGKITSVMVIADALGLDIGNTARKAYGLEMPE